MDSRQGGFASCPFSSLGCGLRVSFRWRLVAGVAARTTGEPTASRRQWRVGCQWPTQCGPKGEKIAGQGRSGNDCSALGISQRPWPRKTLILLLRRDFSGEREIAEIWPVHQHVFLVGATNVVGLRRIHARGRSRSVVSRAAG